MKTEHVTFLPAGEVLITSFKYIIINILLVILKNNWHLDNNQYLEN